MTRTVAVREPADATVELAAMRAAVEAAADADVELEVRMRPYRLTSGELRIRDVRTRVIPWEPEPPKPPELEPYGFWRWFADGGAVYFMVASTVCVAVAFVVTFALAVVAALQVIASVAVGLAVGLLVLLLLALSGGGSCPGLHCGGCRG